MLTIILNKTKLIFFYIILYAHTLNFYYFYVGSSLEQNILTKAIWRQFQFVIETQMKHSIVHVTLMVMVHILYQLPEEISLLMQVFLAMEMEQQVVDHQKHELQPIRFAGVDVFLQTFWLVLKLQ